MKKIRHQEIEENPSLVKTQVEKSLESLNIVLNIEQDSEMFILGLLKEQRQEEIYKEREKQVFYKLQDICKYKIKCYHHRYQRNQLAVSVMKNV